MVIDELLSHQNVGFWIISNASAFRPTVSELSLGIDSAGTTLAAVSRYSVIES